MSIRHLKSSLSTLLKFNYMHLVLIFIISVAIWLTRHYASRGRSYAGLGKYAQAMKDIELAIQLEKDPVEKAEYISTRGGYYFQQGKYDLALVDYNNVLKIDPKSIISYVRQGRAHYKLGQYSEALLDADMALKLDPKQRSPYSVSAYSVMGQVYAKQKNFTKAKATRDRMISINLENRSIAVKSNKSSTLGFLQYDLGEIDNAMSSWKQAVKLNPGSQYESQLAMASVLYNQGKTSAAIQLAKPVLNRYPHLKNTQYLNQSLWGSELLLLANKLCSDRRVNTISWNIKIKK
jgi:tetratricopeptide (TPR) repeat protein